MADILRRKQTAFVLWRAKPAAPPPVLVIGQFEAGNPPALASAQRLPLRLVAGFDDLFEIAAAACNLTPGAVYHYWFEVEETNPHRPPGRVQVSDPFAWTIDWRLRAPRLPPPYAGDDRQPASVVLWTGQRLAPCDPGGEVADLSGDPPADGLPANNRLVIYEMPTAWSRVATPSELGIGVGTFQDVAALINPLLSGANFDDLPVTARGRSYLSDLGVNALELLPPADSFYKREWGYGTAHYLAPDTDLGFPEGYSSSTSNRDLAALVITAHRAGIRSVHHGPLRGDSVGIFD